MIDALARERLTMGLVTLPLLGRGSRPSSLRYQSIKDGVGFGHIDGNCRIDQFDFHRAARRNVQVRHVAGMTGTRHDAVMPGLKCGPAESNEGSSHLPAA